jgi:pyruvate ferredoxin oxidoreductase gamma subunit
VIQETPMHQVRIHGRGGQGVVTAAELLSVAAFMEGKESQAFPSFGSERMGAPVQAFCRIDNTPIRSREPVVTPDAVLVQDATLLAGGPALFAGLTPQGYVLVNTVRPIAALNLGAVMSQLPADHVRTVAASEIAQRHVGRPLPNVPLLGAYVALSGVLRLDSLLAAIREKFPGPLGAKNAAAAEEAYGVVAHQLVG